MGIIGKTKRLMRKMKRIIGKILRELKNRIIGRKKNPSRLSGYCLLLCLRLTCTALSDLVLCDAVKGSGVAVGHYPHSLSHVHIVHHH